MSTERKRKTYEYTVTDHNGITRTYTTQAYTINDAIRSALAYSVRHDDQAFTIS